MPRNRDYLPIGKDPRFDAYHNEYDRLRVSSKILNNTANQLSVHFILFDRERIENELRFRIGDPDKNGEYSKSGKGGAVWMPSILTETEEKLRNVRKRFKSFQKQALSRGRNEPKDWPENLLNERLILEAKLSITEEEITELEKRLTVFTDQDTVTREENVLKNGPKGVGSLSGGVLVELDGMKITETEDGVLIINDPHPKAKPYNGYSTADYFQYIVTEWAILRAKKLSLTRAEARVKGKAFYDIKRGDLLGLGVPWPSMPSTCKNYLAEDTVMKRNKK